MPEYKSTYFGYIDHLKETTWKEIDLQNSPIALLDLFFYESTIIQ